MPKIEIEEQVNAPIETAWKLLGAFGGLEGWAPGVESCALEGSGVGAVRRIGMGGMTIAERLESHDDHEHSFSYSIVEGPLPAENYLATVSLAANASGCTIRWAARFDMPGATDEQARGLAQGIEGSYRGMIAGLKKAVE